MARVAGPDRRRLSAGLLFTAVLLHNLEEGATYALTRDRAGALVRGVWPGAELPAPMVFQAALATLTVAVGALLLWAARTPKDEAGWTAMRVVAAVLLANVLIPHVPAAVALGGYAPGVVTAVAINLPLALWILRRRAD